MKRYIIKRILIIIPTLWVISLIAFSLSKYVPQDTVSVLLNNRGVYEYSDLTYSQFYKELKLDLPHFYFSIIPNHHPKNINEIASPSKKAEVLSALNLGYHYKDIYKISESSSYQKNHLISQLNNNSFNKRNLFYPKFVWHGLKNQYHNWIITMFNGKSIVDGKSALGKVSKGLQWTLSITLVDLILSFILCIYIGKYLIVNNKKKHVQVLSQLLYIIYSIPLFWMATMAVIYLTSDAHGTLLNIFPSVGMNIYPGKSTLYHIAHNYNKLILPILCLSAHSLAYTTRFLGRSIENELHKPYVSTAFSKGLIKVEVIDKHVFKNALIPMVTIFIAATANAFAGSLMLEVIFNIPGIGRLLYRSLLEADWNVVFCIVMIIAFVTTVVYLLGDIIYAIVQPKIRYDA